MSTPTPEGKKAKQSKGDRTKQRIAAVALEAFSERGFNGVSLRDIATLAGITHAGLLHHFTNKGEVLLFALQMWEREELVSFDASAIAGVDYFSALVGIVQLNSQQPHRMSIYVRLSADAIDTNHPAHEYFSRRNAWVVGTLAENFAVVSAATGSVVDRPAEELATELVALMDGLQLQWLLAPEKFDIAGRVHDHITRLGIPMPPRSTISVFPPATKE